MSNRTIVIGDLHGCAKEAQLLLDKCNACVEDRIIFLGDLVDRGKNSAGCVDLAMRIEARQKKRACILGNHEEKHLFYQDIERKHGTVDVKVPTHIETRRQLRPEHYDYLRELPLYIRLPEHNAVCVHAGVFPGRTIEQQTNRHLLHVQMLRTTKNVGGFSTVNEKSVWPGRVPPNEEGWSFWTHLWDGPERIIFGHSVLDRPLVIDNAVGIDGGCCFGLKLWALVLPDWQIVEVDSLGASDPERATRPVTKIHGEVGTY